MRSERLHLAFAGALCCMGAACQEQGIVVPAASEVVVHAVIDMDKRDQYVIVQSTSGALAEQRPVTGALVTITAPDGRQLVADEVADSTIFLARFDQARVSSVYRIALDRAGHALVGGGIYRLHVVLPGGRGEVRGTTTLPHYPLSVSNPPTPLSFDIQRDTVVVAWPRVSKAYSYEVVVSARETSSALFADTSVKLHGALRTRGGRYPFRPGFRHDLVVLAVDANYYDYYRTESDEITGRGVISHLDGGTGVFGSVVRVASRVLDVKCPVGVQCF